MRAAISTDGKMVSAHFGRCPEFTIIDVDEGCIGRREIVRNPGHQPGYIPRFLKERGVDWIIAGGMGRRAMQICATEGIEPILGVQGLVDDVLREIEAGTLEGGESLCRPGGGKGYGLDKESADHESCRHGQ